MVCSRPFVVLGRDAIVLSLISADVNHATKVEDIVSSVGRSSEYYAYSYPYPLWQNVPKWPYDNVQK